MPLTFKENNIRKIVEGKKTQTRRTGRNKLKVGSVYGAKSNWYRKPACYVRILRHRRQRLGDISMEDVQREGYTKVLEFSRAWEKLHGKWNPDKIVDVYDFKLVKPNQRRQTRLNDAGTGEP